MAYKESMALCWAASQDDVGELARLLANGYDLDAADYDGRTAIHLAASNGCLDTVIYLHKQGANINPRDRWNCTPLGDAKRESHQPVFDYLSNNNGKN